VARIFRNSTDEQQKFSQNVLAQFAAVGNFILDVDGIFLPRTSTFPERICEFSILTLRGPWVGSVDISRVDDNTVYIHSSLVWVRALRSLGDECDYKWNFYFTDYAPVNVGAALYGAYTRLQLPTPYAFGFLEQKHKQLEEEWHESFSKSVSTVNWGTCETHRSSSDTSNIS